jgi:hypothetical protein
VVAVCDVATGKVLMKVDSSPGSAAAQYTLAFSPDGRRLAAFVSHVLRSNDADAVKVWDAATGTELLNVPVARPVDRDGAPVANYIGGILAFSPDGHGIVTVLRSSSGANRPTARTLVQIIDATPVDAK